MRFTTLLGRLSGRRSAETVRRSYVAELGLVPDEQVSTQEVVEPAVADARNAAASGDWQPAAALLDSAGQDWDLRAHYVTKLAHAEIDDSWLKAWQGARPEDANAAVVHAESLVSLAWEVRSSLRAQHVSADQFASFHRILADAERAARAAAALLPDDPTPWMTMVTIACGLSYDHERLTAIWSELVARAPHHRAGHDRALQYWCEKWCGSHELMFSFAKQAAASAPSLTPLPLIAGFEYWVQESTDMWETPEMQSAADVVLRDWLNAEGANSPTMATDRSLVATVFTFGRRGAEAVEQFRILGTRGDSLLWGYFGDPPKKLLKIRQWACALAKVESMSKTRQPDA